MRIMSPSLGLDFFCGGFILKCIISMRCQRWPLAALTYIVLIAVNSTEECTFPSACKHSEEDSTCPTLGYSHHEQITVARRTRYSDQPGCHLFMLWFRGLGLSKSVSLKDNQSAININRKRNVRQDSRLPCDSFHRFLEYPEKFHCMAEFSKAV